MSSKPTMLMSPGTSRPASRIARIAPSAMSSLPHNTAVTSGLPASRGRPHSPTARSSPAWIGSGNGDAGLFERRPPALHSLAGSRPARDRQVMNRLVPERQQIRRGALAAACSFVEPHPRLAGALRRRRELQVATVGTSAGTAVSACAPARSKAITISGAAWLERVLDGAREDVRHAPQRPGRPSGSRPHACLLDPLERGRESVQGCVRGEHGDRLHRAAGERAGGAVGAEAEAVDRFLHCRRGRRC